MLQRRRRRNLLHEALGTQHGGEFRFEHLHGHATLVLEILGEIDRGHTARSDLALDAIPVGESSAQTIRIVAHSALACAEQKHFCVPDALRTGSRMGPSSGGGHDRFVGVPQRTVRLANMQRNQQIRDCMTRCSRALWRWQPGR